MEIIDHSSKRNCTENDNNEKLQSKRQFCLSNFEEFSSSTSLHGFQYLGGNKRNFCERTWWLIMITLSVIMCGCFIQKTWNKWNDTPVIVSFAETTTPIWQIPFPAITVCPTTKIIKTKFDVIAKNNDMERNWRNLTETDVFEMEAIQQVCPLGIHENDYIDESYINFLKNLSEVYTEITEWKGQEIFREESWVPITTDNGFCKTFNGLDSTEIFKNITPHFDEYDIEKRFLTDGWSLENGYPKNLLTGETYPRRCSSSMIDGGFRVILFMYEKEINYRCSGTEKGYKITLHSPSDFPMTTHEYFIAPGNQEIMISVKPKIITTSPGLANYDPERRKCFMSKERTLKYFNIYTMRNCEWECLSNYTFQVCGCVRYWMPRERSTPICGYKNIDCTTDASLAMQELGMKYEYAKSIGDTESMKSLGDTIHQCNCMPLCTSLTYDVEITQSPQNYSSALNNIGEPDPDIDGTYVTTLRIFFKESQFITSKRSELFGITDFLGNCGGILGLFLGFSLLSLVEIVYFLTIRPVCNLRKK